MRFLLELDRNQLKRIDLAIAGLMQQPPHQRKLCLLKALEDERRELIRDNPVLRRAATSLRAA